MMHSKNQKVRGHPLYRWGANREFPPLTLETSRLHSFYTTPEKDIIPAAITEQIKAEEPF